MDSKEVILLKKALERQKKARKQAEKILEEKSKELYDVSGHLKETNDRLENLLNEKTSELDGVFINIVDPYVVMDLKFNVIKMNTSAKKFLGYDTDEEKLNLSRLVHPDYVLYTMESIRSLMQVGTLKNYQSKIIVKGGAEKFIQINCSLIYDKNGKPKAAQGIIRDITQEAEIKKLLTEQRQQLDIIVENSPLGIVLSLDGIIIKANKAFTEMLGYSEAELKKIKIKDFTSSEDSEAGKDLMRQLNSGELDRFSLVKKYIRKDGSLLSAKIEVNALKNEKGKTNYQVAIIKDITKDLEAEQQLNTEREKYRNIIANMNLGLIEVDNDGVIQTTNDSFCQMSGFPAEELVGFKATNVIKVANESIVREKTESRFEGISDSYEIEVLNKKGDTRHWFISGAPRYNNTEEIIGSIGIHLDITAQKQLEFQKEQLLKELETSNEGLQEYAHIVSHDLKSPLRSISALATWLTEDYKDFLDDNGVFNLQQIQEKIEGMDALIDGILKYSSISKDRLETHSVNLNLVLNDIREIIFIPEHVHIVVMNTLPVIKADKTKIHQLFQNLIGNAVVHIEREEGLVEIASKETKTHWQFSIKDNGIGIAKEYHYKIFKIFQSISTDKKSTGIGLSIVKKIIDLYKGEIWLESSIGQGTTFHFTLKK